MHQRTCEHILKLDWECLPSWECTWEGRAKYAGRVPSSAIGSVLNSDSDVYLGVSCELTWEHTVKQGGSVRSSAIGSILEGMSGSVVENVL
jgi:hypothetical protein